MDSRNPAEGPEHARDSSGRAAPRKGADGRMGAAKAQRRRRRRARKGGQVPVPKPSTTAPESPSRDQVSPKAKTPAAKSKIDARPASRTPINGSFGGRTRRRSAGGNAPANRRNRGRSRGKDYFPRIIRLVMAITGLVIAVTGLIQSYS